MNKFVEKQNKYKATEEFKTSCLFFKAIWSNHQFFSDPTLLKRNFHMVLPQTHLIFIIAKHF